MQPTQPIAPPPVQLPDASVLLAPWYVWWALIIGLFLMTFIGTWLITRGWKE
ncbi:MAG: hypothetical protein N3D15_05545 [Syntrophorhabdaceae bacterium]|nr:hypothetical protein [Syntrophorhabdaceae bacterium]